MREEQIFEILQKDVEIPEVVQKRAEAALDRVRTEKKRKRRTKWTFKKAVVIFAAVMVITVMVAAVGAHIRQTSMLYVVSCAEEMRKGGELPIYTDFGMTVAVRNYSVDNYSAYIVLEVFGDNIEKGMQPDFEQVSAYVEDKRIKATGQFRDIEQDRGIWYVLQLEDVKNRGGLIGSTVRIELENFGVVDKAQFCSKIQGEWVLEWKLENMDTWLLCEGQVILGDGAIFVKQAELSPLSLRIEYVSANSLKDSVVPEICGVRYKDGTIVPHVWHRSGYRGMGEEYYFCDLERKEKLDVKQVESLLFFENLEQAKALEKGDFQEVKIGKESEMPH